MYGKIFSIKFFNSLTALDVNLMYIKIVVLGATYLIAEDYFQIY